MANLALYLGISTEAQSLTSFYARETVSGSLLELKNCRSFNRRLDLPRIHLHLSFGEPEGKLILALCGFSGLEEHHSLFGH